MWVLVALRAALWFEGWVCFLYGWLVLLRLMLDEYVCYLLVVYYGLL